MVSFCSRKFLFCFTATVLIFFIAGLLYLLRFERVDNLGAYRIPPETGILIPSVCDNYRHDNFRRKKLGRLRSEVVGKLRLRLASAYRVARRLYGSLWCAATLTRRRHRLAARISEVPIKS